MNEEEKIKNIEEILELCREELPYNEDISATLDCEDLKSLECLYKMYKQEKEKNKKLEDKVKCFRDSYEEARIEECDTYFLMNKVIDMIASDYIQDYLLNERSDYPCEYYYGEIKKKDGCKQGKIRVCEECLKEYYFNKAKEKQDDK